MSKRDTAIDSETDLLGDCEAVLNYHFRDRELLRRCLTHSSVARTRLESNERLEFLGDAVMGLIVCEMLYHRLPEEPEGELTRVKSVVVSRNTCAKLSEELGLDEFLLMGKGLSGYGSVPSSIMAAVFESLVGGIYLDGGLAAATEFVQRLMGPEIDRVVETSHGKNYKSLLQQLAQKTLAATPVYSLLDEKGPDHSKCFKVAAVIGSTTFRPAWGPNKKEAEQRAAQNAYYQLQDLEPPYLVD